MSLDYEKFDDFIGIEKSISGFIIKYDHVSSFDEIIARRLHMSLEEYRDILKTCNGVISVHDKNYMFLNEDDIIKAIVMLKLITSKE